MTSLFSPSNPAPQPTRQSPFVLRDYQREDVEAVLSAWESGKRAVVVCQATGLGKSLLIAELAKRVDTGRVLVVVDSTTLATDLYQTIIKHHGEIPGLLTGGVKSHWEDRRVVVCTVQSLYAGRPGEETYRDLDPTQFSAMLVDECETSVATKYGSTMLYFMDGNPSLKMMGCSATPFRGDGRTMGELYDHANESPGVLNRNIMWGVMNGWLVKPRQAFVTCNIDFSSLKVRKQGDGARDFSDADIAKVLLDQDEQDIRAMCEAMQHVAQDKPSIVICPNDINVAKIVAGHLCGAYGDNDIAQAIYGEQGDYADDLIEAYKRGEFQHAVSVNKLYKGFDAEQVRYVFMLRKTKSKRLYSQSMGRGTRPLSEIRPALNAEPSAERRMDIIAASEKPWMCMVDLVGIEADAKDIGVIDIIGEHLPDELRRRTMEMMHERDRNAPEPGSFEDDADGLDVGAVAREANDDLAAEQKREQEEAERKRRALIQVGRKSVNVEYSDDMQAGTVAAPPKLTRGTATPKQVKLLIALGVHPTTALASSKGKAGAIIQSYKKRGTEADWSRVRAWERGRDVE